MASSSLGYPASTQRGALTLNDHLPADQCSTSAQLLLYQADYLPLHDHQGMTVEASLGFKLKMELQCKSAVEVHAAILDYDVISFSVCQTDGRVNMRQRSE